MDTIARPNSPEPRRRRTRAQRDADLALAVTAVAAVAGALAGCEPTGVRPVDVLLTGGLVAIVTTAASRSKRWPLLLLPAAAILGARDWVLIAALASAGAALAGARPVRRSRSWGAVTAGLAVQALLRAPDLGFHGASAVLAAMAIVPVLASGYDACRAGEKRRVRRVVLAVGAVTGLVVVAYGALLLSSFSDITDGNDQARAGLKATRQGDTAAAEAAFAKAEASFASADGRLGGWWTAPARAIPVVGQHAHAVSTTIEQGERLSATAGEVVAAADYQQLRSQGGRFDLTRIAAVEEPLRETERSIAQAIGEIQGSRSSWLAAPLADEVDGL